MRRSRGIADVRRGWFTAGAIATTLIAAAPATQAHKPITSPFTYSRDVLPIVRERCGQCHAPGGVAPMSLLTHPDAVPWGESLRLELTAGHMPPWSVERGAARFRAPGNLSARELNVILTWATGGTPPGDISEAEPAPVKPVWTLGTPDAVLDLPSVTLSASEQERVAEFALTAPAGSGLLRAVDLLPGTPAIVRSASIEVDGQASSAAIRDERVLALWVPGDAPAPLISGAFRLSAGSTLQVRVRYRKTWSYEGKPMTDASRLGLYFAPGTAPTVRAVSVPPKRPIALPEAVHAVAVYAVANGLVTLTATRPDGRREELIAFRPRPGWTRRFWFREPVALPRGTTLRVRVVQDPPALFPVNLAAASVAGASVAGASVATGRLTLDVLK
jgi:hypothetical protein